MYVLYVLHNSELMIVSNFNFFCVAIVPDENDPPLIIDSYGVELLQVSLQPFQPVSGRDHQVIDILRVVYHPEFSPPDFLYLRR